MLVSHVSPGFSTRGRAGWICSQIGASLSRAHSAAVPWAGLGWKSESPPLFADHPCGEKRKRSLEDEGEEDAEDEEDDEDD